MHLYQYQDMATCGGVDPRAGIYREWVAANNVNGEKVTAEQQQLGFALYDQYWLLQRGKKHFVLLKRIAPDDH